MEIDVQKLRDHLHYGLPNHGRFAILTKLGLSS